jgi:hypothetical protein
MLTAQLRSHLSYVIVMNKRKSTFCEKSFEKQNFLIKFLKNFEKSKVPHWPKNRPHQKRELLL